MRPDEQSAVPLSVHGDNASLVQEDTSRRGQLGGKTIGWLGSFALVVNNITGPGMLHLAIVFQKAGLVVPLAVFGLICVSSTGAAHLLCDAITRMPGNANLGVRTEFSDTFSHFLGRRSFTASQVFFFLAIFTQTVASIIGTAQSMDGLIVLLCDRTWAMEVFAGRFVVWTPGEYCGVHANHSECVPFSSFHGAPKIGCIITAGYLATLVLMAPMGFWNLDDNIKFQVISFFVLVILALEFILEMCFNHGIHFSRVPWFGDDYSSVLGTIMFNFAYCPTIPSWLNEKRPEVHVGNVLWSSAFTSTVMYILVGMLSAMSFRHAEGNVLETLSAGHVWTITKVSAFIFGVFVVGLGIPVFCVVMRYNLLVGGVCKNFTATLLGVVMPWALSWLLYQGKAAEIFISASGVVLISLVGFIGPLIVALAASGGLSSGRPDRLGRGIVVRGGLSCTGRMRQMWARAPDLVVTSCPALPLRWRHLQRRYVSVLLVVLMPMVLAGLVLELMQL